MANNCRYANGNLRRKNRARLKAIGAPCGICKGRLGPIHYDEPSDHKHPLSFVIDEIIPVSKATQYGYASDREAAEDWNNLQPAHYICNAKKSDRLPDTLTGVVANAKKTIKIHHPIVSDGNW